MMAGVTFNHENAGPGKANPEEEEEEQEEVRVSFSEEETTTIGADPLVDSNKNNINKKMESYVGRRLTAIEAKVLRKKLLEMAVEEEINALRQQEDREAGFLHDLQHNTLYLGFLFRTFVHSFPLFVPRHPPLFNLHEEGEGEADEKEKEKKIEDEEEREASQQGGYVFWAQMERLVQMVKRLRLSTAAERGQAQSDLDRFWNVVKRRAVQVLQHIVLVVPSPPPSLLMQNNRFDEEEMKEEEEEEEMTAMEKEETEIERETRVYMESLHKFKTSIASTEGLNLFLRMVREKEKLQDMPPDLVNLIRSCYKLMAHNLFLLLHAPSTNDTNNTNDENSSTEDCAANRLASLRSILTWTPFFTLRMMAKVTNPLRLTRSVFGLFLAKPFGCQNLAQRIVEKALETELEEENTENEEEGGGLVEEGEEEQKEEKKEGAEGDHAVDSANKKKLQKKVGNKKAIKQVETYVRDVFPTTMPSFSPAVNRRQSRNKQQLQRLEKILDPSTKQQLTDEQLEAAYLLLIREIKERDGHQLVQLLGDDEVIAILEHLFSIVYRSLFNIYKHTDLPNFIKAIATTLTAIVNTADQYQKQQQELLEKKKKRMKKSTHQKRGAWLNISWLKKNNDDKNQEDESVCNKENGNVVEAKEAEDDEQEKAEEEHIKRAAIEGYVVAMEGFVEEAYGMLHSILVAEQVQAKQAGNGETEDGTFLHMLHWFFVRLQTVVNTLQLRDSPQRQKENDAKRNEDENLYDGGGVIDLQQLLTHRTTSQEEAGMWREVQELVRHYHRYQRYRQQKLQWKLSHHKQQRNNQKSEQNQEKRGQMPLPPPSPDVPNLKRLLPSFNQETHLLFARVEKCLHK
ncbi:hypothetical protein QOT17_020655 [Balamuthia mandrillaris]